MSIFDLFSLEGRVALVTGASRGLGQAIAVALAEAGADVVALSTQADQAETRTGVEAAGRRCLTLGVDLGTASVMELEATIEHVVTTYGRLDILVNNAGTIRRAPLLEYTEADWDAILQINLKAQFFLAQAAAHVMVAQGRGKVINIASLLSFQGGVFVPAYTAAKHGLAGLTRALANELAPQGVNVNAIAPGYMATDNTAALRADADRNSAILARIPAGRWGTADDLRGAVLLLASAASDYMHGEIITVDGGWMGR